MKHSRSPRPDDEDQEEFRKSKSQEKRESHALQAAGERLVDVADSRLALMNLPSDLMETIRFARTLRGNHGAYRREIQHIGAIMRTIDADRILKGLADLDAGSPAAGWVHRRAESWREELMTGDDERLNAFLAEFPSGDRGQIRDLVRSARKEREKQRPPKAFRELYRVLRDVIEASDVNEPGEDGDSSPEEENAG